MLCSNCVHLILTDEAITSSGVIDQVIEDVNFGPSLLYKRVPILEIAAESNTFGVGPFTAQEYYHCIRMQHSRFDVYPSFPRLAESAAGGCPLCQILRQEILHKGEANLFIDPLYY